MLYSTPVRGSVDAGQPDPQHLNSLLALVSANKSTLEEESTTNHINANTTPVSRKNDTQISGDRDKSKQQKTTTKPSINVTTNPLDISLCGSQPACNTQTSASTRGRGRPPGNQGGLLKD